MNRSRALPIAGTIIAACAAGFLFGAAHTSTPEPVSVHIIRDADGEVSDVDLTDADGAWIPAGPITQEGNR